MSFSFSGILSEVANTLAGGNANHADIASQLQGHLGSMSDEQRQNLGNQLLEGFTQHASYQGDGMQAAAEAGTSGNEVAQGSPTAVSSLIDFAKQHPQILESVLSRFAGAG